MVELAGADVVAILTRAPMHGGKSRLFAALGRESDPALLTALLLDTLDAAGGAGVPCVLAVEPPAACAAVGALAPGIEVVPQSGSSLGERMAATMRSVMDRGVRAVAVVGSDLPDLSPDALREAFQVLQHDPDRLVIGPAADGGYYLIAATAVPPVFDGVEWGTTRVLAQTLAQARRHGIDVHLLPVMRDVDSPDDLARVRARRTRAWAAARGFRA